jgi:asparagine synthase (glutamine-hydrolysing)
MCGIAAIIGSKNGAGHQMENMLAAISRRGDTSPSFSQFNDTLLGSVRLKIVDVENGSQPFAREDKKLAIVFNGEIYNHKSLRKQLHDLGHNFKTESDTEIILMLYAIYGNGFLIMLEGMFSIVIHNIETNKFFAARDFFGVKPFYYGKAEDTLFISSEMKSFIGLQIEEYKELKPGHYMTNEGVTQYYKPDSGSWTGDSFNTVKLNLRNMIEDAVRKRVDTDLPIASFLSGGIDSTIIHLLCCKYHSDVTAYIIGDDTGEDVIVAKKLCHDFGLKFKHIKIDKEELIRNVPDIIYNIETFEPNPIRGALLSDKLAQEVHNDGYKIAICGEGADEIFGGYADFLDISDEDEFQQTRINLLNDLYRTQLLRIDRTGMNHAVEVREPYLDRLLVEYVLQIHPTMNVNINSHGNKITKFILREAFKDIVPEYVYLRDKMTLMEGAGIGGVERGKGILYQYAESEITKDDYKKTCIENLEYNLRDYEDVLCFKIFEKTFGKAKFAKQRVYNAQKEISCILT